MKTYLTLILSLFLANCVYAQNLYTLPENFKSNSISSFENINGVKGSGGKSNHTAKGNAFESLKSGESKTLLDIQGPGMIQRMWYTLQNRTPEMLRA
jgi:hypothetical protein